MSQPRKEGRRAHVVCDWWRRKTEHESEHKIETSLPPQLPQQTSSASKDDLPRTLTQALSSHLLPCQSESPPQTRRAQSRQHLHPLHPTTPFRPYRRPSSHKAIAHVTSEQHRVQRSHYQRMTSIFLHPQPERARSSKCSRSLLLLQEL